jgi:hypothetical protein
MAIESFAKAVIAVFEVPTWSHHPSNQLNNLAEKFPSSLINDIKELAGLARDLAPEHDRFYGELNVGLLPSEIYREYHASNAFKKGRKARETTEKVFNRLNIRL